MKIVAIGTINTYFALFEKKIFFSSNDIKNTAYKPNN